MKYREGNIIGNLLMSGMRYVMRFLPRNLIKIFNVSQNNFSGCIKSFRFSNFLDDVHKVVEKFFP